MDLPNPGIELEYRIAGGFFFFLFFFFLLYNIVLVEIFLMYLIALKFEQFSKLLKQMVVLGKNKER